MSSLFGGSTPQVNYTPKGISNPLGFSVSAGGNVTNSPTLNSNIGNLQSTFGQAAGAFKNLAATVAPGFSQLRKAGLSAITNTFRSAQSNLQDTLAQRRILGSSFANSAFSQNASDEAQAKANFEAQSYLQELDASQQLVQEEFNAQSQSFSTAINQSNIESQTAASLVASNNQVASQIASANAQLQAQAQAGAGSFLGTLVGSGFGAAGNIFKGAGTAAASGAGDMISAGDAEMLLFA